MRLYNFVLERLNTSCQNELPTAIYVIYVFQIDFLSVTVLLLIRQNIIIISENILLIKKLIPNRDQCPSF